MEKAAKKICARIANRGLLILALAAAAGLSGCLQPGTGSTSFENTAGGTTIPGGPKAAQVIFTNQAGTSPPTGSFNAAPSSGTTDAAGQGLQAVQLFNPDSSNLTTTGGTSDPNWPAWLNYVEIGISGSSNTAATNANCANFGVGTATCNFPSGTATCDVSNNFRISEYDCVNGGTSVGNGTATDGVYIRAYFNRANLGSTENIMVVVNYAASSFNQAPSNPSSCLSGGIFTPEQCADFTWRVFMRHSPTETYVQPFLMLVPPMYSYVNGNANATGATAATKQFIIPFAGDAALDTIQFSRTGSTLTTGGTFQSDCNGSSSAADSPLCAGIVFYSMTFFRI